jgi:serine protease Do
VWRHGETQHVEVTVAEMPASVALSSGRQATSHWGLTVADITSDEAKQFGLRQTSGVLVTAVTAGSPADDAAIQPGDVITRVERRSVHNVRDFRAALAKAGDVPQLLLLVGRQGQGFFVVLHR